MSDDQKRPSPMSKEVAALRPLGWLRLHEACTKHGISQGALGAPMERGDVRSMKIGQVRFVQDEDVARAAGKIAKNREKIQREMGPKWKGNAASETVLDRPGDPDLSLEAFHNTLGAILEGIALQGTAKWLDDAYQSANQAGMVAVAVKGLREIVKESVREVLRETGLLA